MSYRRGSRAEMPQDSSSKLADFKIVKKIGISIFLSSINSYSKF